MGDRDTAERWTGGRRPAPSRSWTCTVCTQRCATPLDRRWSRVLGHGRFVDGPEVARSSASSPTYCEAEHCVGVANGTDALSSILPGLGIGPGDEVIVPANTFVATAEAVVPAGAHARLRRRRPDTLLIDPDARWRPPSTPAPRAIIAVHLYGQMRRHAGAVGTRGTARPRAHRGRRPGARRRSPAGGPAAVGVAAGLQLLPGQEPRRLRRRRCGGHRRRRRWSAGSGSWPTTDGRQTDRYGHEVVGTQQPARHAPGGGAAREAAGAGRGEPGSAAAVAQYRKSLPAWCVPVGVHPHADPVYHLAVVQVPDRAATARALDAAGIGWGIHYPVPCHLQPAFARYAVEPLPVAEAAADRILSLPLSPTLTNEQVERVSRGAGQCRSVTR